MNTPLKTKTQLCRENESLKKQLARLKKAAAESDKIASEYKKIDTALRDSELQFGTLVSNIPGVVYRRANDGYWTMVYLNKETENLLGYPADAFIDSKTRSYVSSIHVDDLNMVFRVLQESIIKKSPYIIEYRIVHRDGSIKWVYEKGQLVFNDEDKLLYLDGVIFDVTERKQSEEQLKTSKIELETKAQSLKQRNDKINILYREIEKKNKELQRYDQLKSEFVSNVSHELRTPLTSIRNAISNMLAGVTGKVSEEQREHLQMAEEELDRLTHIISSLLDVSKIEMGRIELQRCLIDIFFLAHKTAEILQSKASEKNIKIHISPEPTQTEVFVDPDKIIQILNNLVGNALKYTPENGRITIVITKRTQCVEVSVSDTGIGIEAKNRKKIFERFVQVNRSSGAGEKGTGLGLPISKELVQLHGGKIWVENIPGKGSKFTFTIPKLSESAILREYFQNEIAQSQKKPASLSLIVIQIGKFNSIKKICSSKDTHRLLSNLAIEICKPFHRDIYFISRFREDSFILLLPDTGNKEAAAKEKAIRTALRGYAFITAKGTPVSISVATGSATNHKKEITEDNFLKGVKLALAKTRKEINICQLKRKF